MPATREVACALFALLLAACAEVQHPPEPVPAFPALTQRRFAQPDLEGTALSSAPPELALEGGTQLIRISLGGGDPIDCSVHRSRLSGASRIRGIVSALGREVEVREVGPIAVSMVHGPSGDAPALFVNIVYSNEGAPGEYKVAVLSRGDLSVLCTHDEPGEREAFARVVLGLFATLRDPSLDPGPAPRFHEVQLVQQDGLTLGFRELRTSGPAGGKEAQRLVQESLVVPSRGAKVSAQDAVSLESCDEAGLLKGGWYSLDRDDSFLEVRLVERPGDFLLEGTESGQPIRATLPKPLFCQPPDQALRDLADGKGTEVRTQGYLPALDPRAAHELVYRREVGRTLAVEVAGLGLHASVTVDGEGRIDSTSIGARRTARSWSR